MFRPAVGAAGLCLGLLLLPTSNAFAGAATGHFDWIGVFRQTTARWYLRDDNKGAATVKSQQFGKAGGVDVPVTGNWNDSGGDGIGLYDPNTGAFFLRNGLTTGQIDIEFGFGLGGGFIPVAGDWDNVGGDGIGIYDPSNGNF